MKKIISLALAFLFVFSFAGCNKTNDEYDEEKLVTLEESGAKEYKSPVLIVLGDDNDIFGITQCGNLVIVTNPTNISLRSGMIVSMMDITVDDDGTRRGEFCEPYTLDYERPIYAETNNAPKTCMVMLFENAINNGTTSALEDYNIDSISRDSFQGDHINEGAGIIQCTVMADIKPAKNVTTYGKTDDDGWVRNKTYSFTIWGAQKTWFLKSANPLAAAVVDTTVDVEVGSAPLIYTTDEMLYQYACLPRHSDVRTFDFAAAGNAPEADEYGGATSFEFYTALFAFDKNNEMVVYLEDLKNMVFNFADYSDGKLFLSSKYVRDEVDSDWDMFGYVDESDQKYHKLFSVGELFATDEESLYVLGRIEEDDIQMLHAIDLSTGKIKWSAKLPYDISTVNAVTLSRIKGGYLHIYFGEENQAYKVSTKDGTISYETGN